MRREGGGNGTLENIFLATQTSYTTAPRCVGPKLLGFGVGTRRWIGFHNCVGTGFVGGTGRRVSLATVPLALPPFCLCFFVGRDRRREASRLTGCPINIPPSCTSPAPPHPPHPTRPDTTRHDTTRHDTTRHDTTRHDTTRHDTTRPDTTRPDTTRHDTTRHDPTRPDTTRHDPTRPDTTRPYMLPRRLHPLSPPTPFPTPNPPGLSPLRRRPHPRLCARGGAGRG